MDHHIVMQLMTRGKPPGSPGFQSAYDSMAADHEQRRNDDRFRAWWCWTFPGRVMPDAIDGAITCGSWLWEAVRRNRALFDRIHRIGLNCADDDTVSIVWRVGSSDLTVSVARAAGGVASETRLRI